MDELEAEAGALVEAAVAHLRETAVRYGLPFDDRAQSLAKQKLGQQGFASRAEVVRFFEAPPSALHDVVQATCDKYADKIIADLGSLAATSPDLQQPSRWRREGHQARDTRFVAQLHAAATATERLLEATKGSPLEAAANEARSTEDPDAVDIPGEAVCDFEEVWRELCMMYTDAHDEETLTNVAQIVMPHLFRACTRTIAALAIQDHENDYELLTEMLDDVNIHVPHLCLPSVQRVLYQLDAATSSWR